MSFFFLQNQDVTSCYQTLDLKVLTFRGLRNQLVLHHGSIVISTDHFDDLVFGLHALLSLLGKGLLMDTSWVEAPSFTNPSRND